MHWHPADCDNVAAPARALALLEQAIAAAPGNPGLLARRGDLHFEHNEFERAADDYAAALAIDPARGITRMRLARCKNVLGEPHTAIDVLSRGESAGTAQFERGMALLALGDSPAAEAEFRGVLADDSRHRRACKELCRILRKSRRLEEVLELCAGLHARGVDHAQLFYEWGRALALTGAADRARALLFDPARVRQVALPAPEGFATIEAFNAELAEELLTNPNRLTAFAPGEEANRGSSRVHSLFAGKRPQLVRQLLDIIQSTVAATDIAPSGAFDPWPAARPAEAHLRPWGLIQRGDAYEEWHHHRGGWMSGVYYVRVPDMVSVEGEGPGCIEFGVPPSLLAEMPGLGAPWRHAPRAGTMLLAPSHYAHRTIPTGADEYRISLAFDVVPRDPT